MLGFHSAPQEGGPGKRSSNLQSMSRCLFLLFFYDSLAYCQLCVLCPGKPDLAPQCPKTQQQTYSAWATFLPSKYSGSSARRSTIKINFCTIFCPVLPPADHYYTQGSLTSQWKLVKIIGYFYLNTGRRAKPLFFLFFLAQMYDYKRCWNPE